MAPYVRNLWYMAAWEREIEGDALLERTLLEPWLIFRLDDGSGYAILANRCPHRFAALSKDRRQGNAVACPYHGLTSTRRGSVADCSAEKCAAGCALACARVDAVAYRLHADGAASGKGAGRQMVNPHIITPETQASSHYFYTCNPDAESEELARRVFNDEDRPVLEDIQRHMGEQDFWSMKPLILAADAGGIRARRRLM